MFGYILNIGLLLSSLILSPYLSVLFFLASFLRRRRIILFSLLILTSLSSDFFKLGVGLGFNRILFLFVCLDHILRNRPKYRFNGPLVYSIVIFVLLSIISIIWSATVDIDSYMVLFQNILVFYFISTLSTREHSDLLNYLRFGGRLLLVALPIFFWDLILDVSMTRLLGFEDELINPNRLATMMGLLGVFSISGRTDHLKGTLLNIFFIILCAILIFVTGSRSNLLAFGLCVILAYVMNGQLNRLITVFFLSFLFAFYYVDFDSWDYIVKRFSTESMSLDGASVRLKTWQTLFPLGINQYLLTGVGFGALNVYNLALDNGLSFSAHNLWIDSFLQLGVVGVILVGFMVIICIKYATEVFFLSRNNILLLFGSYLLTLGFAETVFSEKYFFIFLALVNNAKTVGYAKT